jgi:predicted permease
MRLPSRLTGAWRAIVHRERVDAELDEELREYLAASIEAKEAAGLPREEAVRQARAEMGSPAAARDWVRDVGWEARLESVWQDVRYAGRALRRSPAFTLAGVLTLALGIGATTAIYTLVEAVVLHPLPVDEADRVVRLLSGEGDATTRGFTYPAYLRFRDQTGAAFDAAGASAEAGVRVTVGDDSRQVLAAFVNEEYFDAVGIQAARGRLFARSEHAAGAEPAVILTDAFWRARLGADPAAIGRTIQLANATATIAGVAPRGFRGLDLSIPVDLFVPLMSAPLVLPPANYFHDTPAVVGGLTYSPQAWVGVTARLKRDVPISQAEALLSSVRIEPAAGARRQGAALRLVPATNLARGMRSGHQAARFATLLAAVVSLVLLVGCANLSGLLLARYEQRRRETAVRLALGAERARVVRLFLAESLLLSLLGAGAGLLFARWMLDAMGELVIPGRIPLDALQLAVTERAVVFSGAAALFTAAVAGLLPAWLGSRLDLAAGLNTRLATPNGRGFVRGALVTGQVALSLVLIVGAMLFVRSLRAALATDVGVDTSRIAYASVSFWTAGYDAAGLARFTQRVVEALAAQPGVERATYGALPLADVPGSGVRYVIDGQPRNLSRTLEFGCGPDYFATIGVEIVEGRALAPQDARPGSPPVVVVNDAFARQAWPGAGALGRRIVTYPRGPELEVVGVARDGKYAALSEQGRLAIYLPWHLVRRQAAGARETFVVRSRHAARAALPLLRQEIRRADPRLPIMAAGTLDERIAALAMTQRIGASLLGWFSAVAFALAIVGIYGLIAYAVTRRTHEIGIHIALGADPATIVARMMRRSLMPVAFGVMAGLGGAVWLSHFAAGFLFGIAATDPASFAGATLLLLVAAAAASYIPARRAARVDPMAALRAE